VTSSAVPVTRRAPRRGLRRPGRGRAAGRRGCRCARCRRPRRRRPGTRPTARAPRVRAAPAQQRDQGECGDAGEERTAGLQGLVAGAVRGEDVDGEAPALGDGRVNGVHGGAVDQSAAAVGCGMPVPGRAVVARGEEPGVAQPAQFGRGRRVRVGRDARGLHPAVPCVAVHVVAGARRPRQPREAQGGAARDDQGDGPPHRHLAYGEDRPGEQRPGGAVPEEQARGVAAGGAEAACRADGGGDDRREGGYEDGGGGGGGSGSHRVTVAVRGGPGGRARPAVRIP
jgi:hypothetical protein